LTDAFTEPYTASPTERRTVQYFDKSRMEITQPQASDDGIWYVTNGLLVVELVTGRVQVGDADFIETAPATVQVAGDPDALDPITYALLGDLLDVSAHPVGFAITARATVSRTDNPDAASIHVTDDPSLAMYGVSTALVVPETGHAVASIFWDFMQSRGVVSEDGERTTAALFENPFYATGFPITEAYWSTVTVGGQERTVLLQCFERRCLTYTPDNPAEWQVEMGNVGRHYYAWRYGDESLRVQNLERAIASYDALQANFYIPDLALYRETAPSTQGNPYAYHWPFTRATAATVLLSGVPRIGDTYLDDLQARFLGGERYWDAAHAPPGYASYLTPPYGTGGDLFYDDNAWTGLNLVRMYRLTGDTILLGRAREVFDVLASGWDDDSSHPAPGGVFWVDADWNRDRNVVSTGTSAQLGLHLYELTGEQQYLDWALRMNDWVNTWLRGPNGLYWDHIDLAGTIEPTQWSYNQGTMIGVNVLLARITGDLLYRERAVAIAEAALALYGTEDRLAEQPPEFNAIFAENLLLLFWTHPDPDYLHVLRAYADHVWETRRDPVSGLFTISTPVHLHEQAAMVAIYAVLAWAPQDYGWIA